MNPLRRRILHALAASLATLHVRAQPQRKSRRVFWFPNNGPATQEQDAIRKAIAAAGFDKWRGVDLSLHYIERLRPPRASEPR